MAFGQAVTPPYNELEFNTYDYVIGGKLIVCNSIIDDSYDHLMKVDFDARDKFKYDIASKMACYMIENNLMEFTSMKDPITMRTRVACRAYLAPSDQVRILRLANKVI